MSIDPEATVNDLRREDEEPAGDLVATLANSAVYVKVSGDYDDPDIQVFADVGGALDIDITEQALESDAVQAQLREWGLA